jgi:hypothetical protein
VSAAEALEGFLLEFFGSDPNATDVNTSFDDVVFRFNS